MHQYSKTLLLLQHLRLKLVYLKKIQINKAYSLADMIVKKQWGKKIKIAILYRKIISPSLSTSSVLLWWLEHMLSRDVSRPSVLKFNSCGLSTLDNGDKDELEEVSFLLEFDEDEFEGVDLEDMLDSSFCNSQNIEYGLDWTSESDSLNSEGICVFLGKEEDFLPLIESSSSSSNLSFVSVGLFNTAFVWLSQEIFSFTESRKVLES